MWRERGKPLLIVISRISLFPWSTSIWLSCTVLHPSQLSSCIKDFIVPLIDKYLAVLYCTAPITAVFLYQGFHCSPDRQVSGCPVLYCTHHSCRLISRISLFPWSTSIWLACPVLHLNVITAVFSKFFNVQHLYEKTNLK